MNVSLIQTEMGYSSVWVAWNCRNTKWLYGIIINGWLISESLASEFECLRLQGLALQILVRIEERVYPVQAVTTIAVATWGYSGSNCQYGTGTDQSHDGIDCISRSMHAFGFITKFFLSDNVCFLKGLLTRCNCDFDLYLTTNGLYGI